ncbi:MAG: hypothetical protein U5R31_17045 [Acidimicrobiia bacterium]|nr:hypothetical protein [Acidimicrobiia bacterium]
MAVWIAVVDRVEIRAVPAQGRVVGGRLRFGFRLEEEVVVREGQLRGPQGRVAAEPVLLGVLGGCRWAEDLVASVRRSGSCSPTASKNCSGSGSGRVRSGGAGGGVRGRSWRSGSSLGVLDRSVVVG